MAESETVRAVFFDVVDTLIHVRGSVGRIYWEMARPHGVRSDPEAIDRAFSEVFRSVPPLAFPGAPAGTVRRLEKQWWHAVVRRVFDQIGPLERFDDYFESVFGYFSTPEAWEVYPDTVSVLSALKGRGLILGIISNFDSRIYPLLSGLGLFKWTDSITISSREGTAKPDGRIFSRALSVHDLLPGEALHVGDSIREDVEGARSAGLKALHLCRDPKKSRPGIPAIGSLEEVLPQLTGE